MTPWLNQPQPQLIARWTELVYFAGGLGRLNDHVRDYESLRMDVGFRAAYTQQRKAAKLGFTAFGR